MEKDPTSSFLAVKAYAYLKRKESLDVLSHFARDQMVSPGVRRSSVMMMGRMGGEPALPMLLQMARGETHDPQVRSTAIMALGELRSVPQAAIHLESLYHTAPDVTTRSQIMVAFARRHTAASVGAIERLYQGETDEKLRRTAVTSLGSVRNKEATRLLESIALRDPSTIVRDTANTVLESRRKLEARRLQNK